MEKKKFHFNGVDIFICVLIVLLAAAAFVRFHSSGTTGHGTASEEIVYEVRIYGVRSLRLDSLAEGDTLYDNESGTAVGTITSITTEPARYYFTNSQTGEGFWGTQEDRIDITISATCSGTVENGHYYAAGTYELNVGSARAFSTKYQVLNGRILSIYTAE